MKWICLIILLASLPANTLLASLPANTLDNLSPPWSKYWSDGYAHGKGKGSSEWNASSNSYEGYADVEASSYTDAKTPIVNHYTAGAWFGHGDNWTCPETGNYTFTFKYRFRCDSSFTLFYIPIPPIPNVLVSMTGTITYRFGDKNKTYSFIDKPEFKSIDDILKLKIENITCYKNHVYNFSIETKISVGSISIGARPTIGYSHIYAHGKLLEVTHPKTTPSSVISKEPMTIYKGF